MKNSIVSSGKKLIEDALVKIGKIFFKLESGELLGFRAGLGLHTLVKENGDLVPGHDQTIFVEEGKDISSAKNALDWAKTLNLRRIDFGKEYEISAHSLSLVAVIRKHDSDDLTYISKKFIDILPHGEDKESDDIYGVTPSIGKTAVSHYIGIPIQGNTEEELLKNANDFIENLQQYRYEYMTNEKMLQSNDKEIDCPPVTSEKNHYEDNISEQLPMSVRRTLKQEVNSELKNEAKNTYKKMTARNDIVKEKS